MANQQESGHAHADGAVHAHISPVRFYWGILAILMVFTVLTYGLAFVELGAANLAVAIIIATLKATLVVLFFMHLWWDSKFNALVFVGSLLFLAMFLVYTVNDTGNRDRIDQDLAGDPRGRYSASAGEWAPAFGPNVGQLVYASGPGHDEAEAGEAASEEEAAAEPAATEPVETGPADGDSPTVPATTGGETTESETEGDAEPVPTSVEANEQPTPEPGAAAAEPAAPTPAEAPPAPVRAGPAPAPTAPAPPVPSAPANADPSASTGAAPTPEPAPGSAPAGGDEPAP